MNTKSKLYEPIQIGRFTLKNRITIAPHGTALHERDGSAGEKLMAYLRNEARSGAAMVTIGSGNISRNRAPFPLAYPASPFLIGNYKNISELMHQYDCKISMQLYPSKEMMTPSEVVCAEATPESIADLCKQYADAAYNCMMAGFDFVMIHGAHGNGPSMFFSPKYNHRTDEYGGSLENRARFALEVLDAIRERCGDKIGIEYRLSAEEMIPGGATLEETLEFAKLIQDKIDLLHISRGLLENDDNLPYLFTPTYFKRGIHLKYARRFKEVLHIPVNVIGGFNIETAEKAVDDGAVDMVSACRTFIADPLAMTKAIRGQKDQIRPCIRCNVCINTTHGKLHDLRCSVNPLIGRESRYPDWNTRAAVSKKVLLAGGGPANLEAARTAARRGHKVILAEKDSVLGGKLNCASQAPFKEDLKKYLDWSVRTVTENPDIEIRLNTEVTPELIRQENPDALIIAIGGEPVIPHFTASGTDKVEWVGNIGPHHMPAGKNILVAGGGFTGLEAALELAMAGKAVTVVDMIPEAQLGNGGTLMNTVGLLQLLKEHQVKFICDTKILDVTEEGMTVQRADGSSEILSCDTVVISFGTKKDPEKVAALCDIVPETYVIGDCSHIGGTVWPAVRSGFDMAMDL